MFNIKNNQIDILLLITPCFYLYRLPAWLTAAPAVEDFVLVFEVRAECAEIARTDNSHLLNLHYPHHRLHVFAFHIFVLLFYYDLASVVHIYALLSRLA